MEQKLELNLELHLELELKLELVRQLKGEQVLDQQEVQEEDGVECASIGCSCNFSRSSTVADEPIPCFQDVPLHCEN